MTITVNVTQADIDRGKPMDPHLCPIMYGIWSAGLHPKIYSVGRAGFYAQYHKDFETLAPLTADARHFLDAFDDGNKVKPFTFEIELPEDL